MSRRYRNKKANLTDHSVNHKSIVVQKNVFVIKLTSSRIVA